MADRSRQSINPRCPSCGVRHARPMHEIEDDETTETGEADE